MEFFFNSKCQSIEFGPFSAWFSPGNQKDGFLKCFAVFFLDTIFRHKNSTLYAKAWNSLQVDIKKLLIKDISGCKTQIAGYFEDLYKLTAEQALENIYNALTDDEFLETVVDIFKDILINYHSLEKDSICENFVLKEAFLYFFSTRYKVCFFIKDYNGNDNIFTKSKDENTRVAYFFKSIQEGFDFYGLLYHNKFLNIIKNLNVMNAGHPFYYTPDLAECLWKVESIEESKHDDNQGEADNMRGSEHVDDQKIDEPKQDEINKKIPESEIISQKYEEVKTKVQIEEKKVDPEIGEKTKETKIKRPVIPEKLFKCLCETLLQVTVTEKELKDVLDLSNKAGLQNKIFELLLMNFNSLNPPSKINFVYSNMLDCERCKTKKNCPITCPGHRLCISCRAKDFEENPSPICKVCSREFTTQELSFIYSNRLNH